MEKFNKQEFWANTSKRIADSKLKGAVYKSAPTAANFYGTYLDEQGLKGEEYKCAPAV